jgi:CheY-like chemotaxis protein
VTRGLTEAGLAVVHSTDSDGAVGAAIDGAFDVIVLDVMLPGSMDGFEAAARLRQRQVGTPILKLTGRDAVVDRVRGLESGADDYLLKPLQVWQNPAKRRIFFMSRPLVGPDCGLLVASALASSRAGLRVGEKQPKRSQTSPLGGCVSV